MKKSEDFPKIMPISIEVTLGNGSWFHMSKFENHTEYCRHRVTLEEKQLIADYLLELGHRIKNENRRDNN